MQTSFKRDPAAALALATLSPGQRIVFGLLAVGSIFPVFFVGFVRPVLVLAAFQLACASAMLFMRWRLPGFRGSFWTFSVAAIASVVALVAALAQA